MKKAILLTIMMSMVCAMVTGSNIALASGLDGDEQTVIQPEMTTAPFDLEIREKMFLTQMNDIYVNIEEYIGKSIKIEGMFMASYYEPTDAMFYMVMRYGPGCCGNDGIVGFEVAFDELVIKTPETNDWVEAVGVLEWYEEFEQMYLRLALSSLRVLDTRGLETVQQ